jgi:alkaline phosphatase D
MGEPESTYAAADTEIEPGPNSYSQGPLLAGPLLGEVGVTDAYIWAQARDTTTMTLDIHKADGSTQSLTAQPSAADWLCTGFHVTDLAPGTDYEYSLRSAHGQTARHPLRLAPPSDARRLKLALGSCYKDYKTPELPIFAAIAREAPDAFLMLGDNCYFTEES